MKCTCCSKTDIVAYITCFGGGVYPLWFCEDHIIEGGKVAEKWNKNLIHIQKMTFKIGDKTFKKYATLKSPTSDKGSDKEPTENGLSMFKKYASAKW